MPETALTPLTPLGPYPASVAINTLDVTWTASDASNNNKFAATGRDLLLVRNVAVGAKTFTLTSQYNAYNRLGTITAYSLGASEVAMFWFGNTAGWADSSGNIILDSEDANIEYAVVRIPS